MTHQKDNLENLCLFKLQMEHRVLKGHANKESSCYTCRGYEIWCDDYSPIKDYRDLAKYLENK